jgi:beta-lactamase regulating signal transducer with metallopeptidase domain
VLSVPLTAMVWLALRLTPRRTLDSAARYLIWWTALIACLALPAFFLQSRPAVQFPPSEPGRLRVQVFTLESQPAAHPQIIGLPLSVPAAQWLDWLPAAWLLTSSILLLRLLVSHCATRRVCARAKDFSFSHETWRAAAGSRGHSVRITTSIEASAPFAAGPFGPAIVIPDHLIDRLAAADLHRIGLHEAVHLARRDDCAILAERLLIAVFPWHLAAHWIVRQIDAEREIACDDRVVERTCCARDYAECLMRVIELCGAVRGPLVAGMAGHRTRLSRRVELLIGSRRHPRPGLLRAPVLTFAAGLLAVLLLFGRAPLLIALSSPPAPLTSTPISTFQQEKSMTLPTAKRLVRKLAVTAAATTALAVPAASQAQPQPAVSGRYVAILIDAAGLSASDLRRASDTAVRLVQDQMRAGDKTALMVTTDRGVVTVRQDFTSDRDVLTKAAQDIVKVQNIAVVEVPRSSERWTDVLGASLQMLGRLSGKKLLVSMGAGSPILSPGQTSGLIGEAIKANVAVYQIDVR